MFVSVCVWNLSDDVFFHLLACRSYLNFLTEELVEPHKWVKSLKKNYHKPHPTTGFAWSLKVCNSLGEIGYTFEGLESQWKLSGVCESLWILWSSECRGKTTSLSVRNCIFQDWTVLSSSVFLFCFKFAVRNHKECTSCQFWLIECISDWLQ